MLKNPTFLKMCVGVGVERMTSYNHESAGATVAV